MEMQVKWKDVQGRRLMGAISHKSMTSVACLHSRCPGFRLFPGVVSGKCNGVLRFRGVAAYVVAKRSLACDIVLHGT